jgi:hypothetical protein
LLLLIIFFTFLTAYALFSGKIKTCGCFGDCLPLTPLQSFLKDLGLLLLILILFIYRNKISPSFRSGIIAPVILLTVVLAVSFLQHYVLTYLPIVDCLPYKKGNNLLEQMKVPEGAMTDSFAITFRYKKNGKNVEFDADNFPEDFDSTYEYVDRYDKQVRQGNATPAISDFSLKSLYGNDTTDAVLNKSENYLLVFTKDFQNHTKWKNERLEKLMDECRDGSIDVFIVTADVVNAQKVFQGQLNINILTSDYTVIKTAARVNPTFFIMNEGKVLEKMSYQKIDELNSGIHNYYNRR